LIKVTVLMPVYNGERYLIDSISSILNQTYKNFEFLIIDDGSTDLTSEIIESFNDPRIRLVNNKKNIGLTRTLNKGIKLSRGKYIARMDADDISLPERLKKQVDFMEEYQGIGVCGTWLKTTGSKKNNIRKSPINHEEICAYMFWDSPIWHPTAMIRKEVLTDNNLYYDESISRAQDYKLWIDISNITKLANIPEVLLLYRIHNKQISKLKNNPAGLRNKIFEDFFNRPLAENEINMIELMYSPKEIHNVRKIEECSIWISNIRNINLSQKKYPEPNFSKVFKKIIRYMYRRLFYENIRNTKYYNPIMLLKALILNKKIFWNLGFKEIVKTIIKCTIFWPNKNYKETLDNKG